MIQPAANENGGGSQEFDPPINEALSFYESIRDQKGAFFFVRRFFRREDFTLIPSGEIICGEYAPAQIQPSRNSPALVRE